MLSKTTLIKIFYVSIVLLLPSVAKGQKLVNDTLLIDFTYDTIIPISVKVEELVDTRNANPRMVSYSSKKKFLIVPVDQEISLKNPLSEELKASLDHSLAENISDSFNIDIAHFYIDKFKGRISNYYVLKADFLLSRQGEKIGTLSYSYEYAPKHRKTQKTTICEDVMYDWHRQFKLDLLELGTYVAGKSESGPDNFIEKELKKHSFMNTNVSAVLGLNFWQVEGELYFSRPEVGRSQVLQGGIVRYQKTDELEMVGFGGKSEHFRKRFNNNTLLDVNSNLLIGINKWKYPDDIKFEQIFQLSLSSSQSIAFERKNEAGLVLKTGLFENVYYIMYKPIKLQLGIYLSAGYKF